MNNCINCNKETTNPKFCSRSCAAKINNVLYVKRKLDRKCLDCDKIVSNHRKYRCEEHLRIYKELRYQSYKNKTLEEYHSLLSVKGKHSSWLNSHVRILNRMWNKELTKLPCANCRYDKHVELCHRKEVSSYPKTAKLGTINAKSNNIQLCRNCHWEFDNGLLKI